MKKYLPAFFLAFIIACGSNDKNENEKQPVSADTDKPGAPPGTGKPAKAMFDIPAAKIDYRQTGGPDEGTETLYFEDYGNTAVLVSNRKTKYEIINQAIIWKDGKSTMINHENKTVTTSPFRPKATEAPSIADLPEATRVSIGYEKLPDEMVAGKQCEVWQNKQLNVTYWLWNRIEMKISNMGVYTREAESIKQMDAIPAAILQIPPDYKK